MLLGNSIMLLTTYTKRKSSVLLMYVNIQNLAVFLEKIGELIEFYWVKWLSKLLVNIFI